MSYKRLLNIILGFGIATTTVSMAYSSYRINNSASELVDAAMKKPAYTAEGRQAKLGYYNRAIELAPNDASIYHKRAVLKGYMDDHRGALADFNRTIEIGFTETDLDRKMSAYLPYGLRGDVKAKLNDVQGAIADYNQSIKMNSKDLPSYVSRGKLKANKLNDVQGALADFNRVITLDPDSSGAYYERGMLKKDKLNDRTGAIADLRIAAKYEAKFTEAVAAGVFHADDRQTTSLTPATDQLKQLGVDPTAAQ
jgi:tetratricopeptide (TPR) repeat protein